MKKKNHNIIIFFIILFIAVFHIIYGITFQIHEVVYHKTAIKTKAKIQQITKNKDTTTIYLDYKIKKKKYNGVYTTNKKNMTINDQIILYCNPKNLSQFTDGTIKNYGYYLILLGIIFIGIDISVFKTKKN